ncbi:hypothetical protein JCM10213_002025 [Rhodosporidiobolus nylandii]
MATFAATPPVRALSDGFETVLVSTPDEMARSMAIRYTVFCVEQGYEERIERDSRDAECDHILLVKRNEDGSTTDAGTVRWYASQSKLGRFAMHKQFRGCGAGTILCLALEEHIRQRKGLAKEKFAGQQEAEIVAWSQKIAEGFYHKMGWETVGDDFIEEGQPHCKVVKRIKLVSE